MSFDSDPREEFEPVTERTWPSGGHFDPAESQSVVCSGCRALWHIHQDLAGFRKQCDCGHWIEVPALDQRAGLIADTTSADTRLDREVAAVPSVRRNRPRSRPEALGPAVPRAEPHQPMTIEERAHTPVIERRRQLGAVVLELAMIGFALMVIPALFAALSGSIEKAAVWMPVTSVLGGALVVGIVSISPFVRRQDFAIGRFEHWAEALVATAGFFALALAFQSLFEDRDGLDSLVSKFDPMTALFVIAVCPALFEELAFRGAVFARMRHVFGLKSGILYTSITFALAHGHTVALPIHLAIGLYLTWLRHRAGTIWPGVLCHLCYNGGLVLWTIG